MDVAHPPKCKKTRGNITINFNSRSGLLRYIIAIRSSSGIICHVIEKFVSMGASIKNFFKAFITAIYVLYKVDIAILITPGCLIEDVHRHWFF